MPFISMKEMLEDARKRRYAASYCESWNLESLQATVEAAEEEKSPIIVGFNGGFLLRSGQKTFEQLGYYASFREALDRAKVPVAFLLNESDSIEQLEQAISLGFDSVMPENEDLPAEEYLHMVKHVVEKAHAKGVTVEAQVARLADVLEAPEAQPTDPEAARAFVKATN